MQFLADAKVMRLRERSNEHLTTRGLSGLSLENKAIIVGPKKLTRVDCGRALFSVNNSFEWHTARERRSQPRCNKQYDNDDDDDDVIKF